ncbi:glycosyltransferase family 2 protein [Butyricicoccus sp.]|uniref:glycosyltransferase family 2 protein n=1 Tax=Butyricicoccus sp. TaxID=2049021 RepID=UPI003F1645A6
MGSIFCSVIVPVYNAEPYLARCIDSIRSQTCGDFELILINDGSTDQSGEICNTYAQQDTRIQVIHQENGGHTAARNAGIQAAAGEYVAFVDSDDWIDSGLLGDCLAVVQQDEPDIVLYGYRRVGDGHIREKKQPYPTGNYDRGRMEAELFPTLLTKGRFSLSERIMKRELAQKHQLSVDRRILLGEDLLCCVCAMAEAQRVSVLEGVYYNYYQHASSVAHSHTNYTFENWLLLREHLDRQLSDVLPDYETQLGICSVRFLHRAVLGELARDGWNPKTVHRTAKQLGEASIRQNIRHAAKPDAGMIYRFKVFCLRHRQVSMLYAADRAIAGIRKIRG